MILSTFLFLLFPIFGVSGTTNSDLNFIKKKCRLPFTNVGGYCLQVVTVYRGTWSEMSNFCGQQGGRLAILDDANLMYDLARFIYDNGLDVDDFWIGATDVEEEGRFKWVDGREVKMGSPFWGYHDAVGIPEPNGGTRENCALIWKGFYYDIGDFFCTEDRGAICEQVD